MASAARARVRIAAITSQLRAGLSSTAASGVTPAPTAAAIEAALTATAIPGVPRHRQWPASLVKVSAEVAHALDNKLPVVALESTIISHGMPYPKNVETALSVEAVARANGCVPATIAILKGVIHVGLGSAELETLGRLGHACAKCSRRDLAQSVATRGNGATTVAATMFVAHMVGIDVFVTGGIGGVHRGAEETMDISADLTELGRTPVAVVCAGVKSILDIPKTIEFLETQGVAVIALGQKQFPAFFTADSGHAAPASLDSVQAVAATLHANRQLQLESGTVIAVPVPAHQAAEAGMIETATQTALRELKEKHIGGRDVTPYLLARVNELTGGKSLEANIALINNNCLIGSQIAFHLSALRRAAPASASRAASTTAPFSGVAIFGGINHDVLGAPAAGVTMRTATSTPGRVTRQWGGVGRNIAECVARLGVGAPRLISAVGDDTTGDNAISYCRGVGIDTQYVVRRAGHVTSTYLAVLDEHGDVFATIADMAVIDTLTPDTVDAGCLRGCALVAVDGNVSERTIQWLSSQCASRGIPVWFEPTSVVKSLRALSSWTAGSVTVMSPNVHELQALSDAARGIKAAPTATAHANSSAAPSDANAEAIAAAAQLEVVKQQIAALFAAVRSTGPAVTRHIVLKRGARGVVIGTARAAAAPGTKLSVEFRVLPAAPLSGAIVNTSGAGDTLVGGALAQLAALHRAKSGATAAAAAAVDVSAESLVVAVECGLRCAAWKVVQSASVSPLIDAKSVGLKL